MTLAKSQSWMMIQEGYKLVAMYYNKLGTQIECIQKDDHCIVYIYQKRHSCWVNEFHSKDKANEYILDKVRRPFDEGGWVRNTRSERTKGIRR